MKVRCVHRHGDRIPEDVLALGNTSSARFDVSYGREYMVFGICLSKQAIPPFSKGVIEYLVLNDETYRPDWMPAFLFQVIDPQLPSKWFFCWKPQCPDLAIEAIWGYAELAASDGRHCVDLIERKTDALQVFQRRRAEIETDVSLSKDK